jgi:hypothetical protein
MIDGMSLKGVLTLLQEIACAKSEHLQDIEDWPLAKEWERWSRLSEQIFRVDKWSLCRG